MGLLLWLGMIKDNPVIWAKSASSWRLFEPYAKGMCFMRKEYELYFLFIYNQRERNVWLTSLH